MGIRIHKEIGYFLPLHKYNRIIVPDYNHTMEELDYNQKCIQKFWDKLIHSLQHYSSSDEINQISTQLLGKQYQEDKLKETMPPYNLIRKVYFSDEEKGILFRTKELYSKSRYDNIMDYYEADFNDTINCLNRSIHPIQGYIYKGGLTETFPKMVEGEVYNDYIVHAAFQRIGSHNQASMAAIAEGIVDTGYFHPNIEPAIYLIAKAAGLLEHGISEKQFNLQVQPAILTYWS